MEASSTDATPASSASAFHFVRVTHDLRTCAAPECGGFFVTPLDAATLECGPGNASASCYVADLQLSTADVARDEFAEALAPVSAATDTFALVLVGRVAPQGAGPQRLFQAYELWTSSRPVPVATALYHVTTETPGCSGGACAKVTSVALGSWASLRSDAFDRSALAPHRVTIDGIEQCGVPPTSITLEGIDFASSTSTGVIAAGVRSAAKFVATDVFVRRMANRACDHSHGTGGRVCCGPTEHCNSFHIAGLVAPKPAGSTFRPPPNCEIDHILGGIEVEYSRSVQLSAWLQTTHQPASPTSHVDPPVL